MAYFSKQNIVKIQTGTKELALRKTYRVVRVKDQSLEIRGNVTVVYTIVQVNSQSWKWVVEVGACVRLNLLLFEFLEITSFFLVTPVTSLHPSTSSDIKARCLCSRSVQITQEMVTSDFVCVLQKYLI